MRNAIAVVLLTVVANLCTAAEAVADAHDVQVDEAFVLSLVNAYRADPAKWDFLISVGISNKALSGKGDSWKQAVGRAAKSPPAPPLVWDPVLAEAARASLLRFARAPEGAPHDPAPELSVLGITMTPATGLLLEAGGANLRYVFAQSVAHVIHQVKGTSGTTYSFARQQLCHPAATACGIAVAKAGSGYRLAVIVADRNAGRAVCGLGFRDLNRNGAPDQGEPLVPTAVTLGVASIAQNFPTGIWTVPLPPAGPTTVAVTSDGGGCEYAIAATTASAWVAMPQVEKADVAEARKYVLLLTKTKPSGDVPDKAAFDLYCLRPRFALDTVTASEVAVALVEVTTQIDRARREFLEHQDDDNAIVGKRLADFRKRWNGRGGAWLDFAKVYHQLFQEFGAWGRLEGEDRVATARRLLKTIDLLAAKKTDAVLWEQILNWKVEFEMCIYGAERLTPPPVNGKKKTGEKAP